MKKKKGRPFRRGSIRGKHESHGRVGNEKFTEERAWGFLQTRLRKVLVPPRARGRRPQASARRGEVLQKKNCERRRGGGGGRTRRD